jgi:hypothetical protein
MSKQVREYENKLKIKVTEMSSREISNAKNPPSAREILRDEYPTIHDAYEQIIYEQFDLFAKKHLDYGMHNVSAGTNLETADEMEFAMTGLWYRLSDKINRWKNMIISGRKAQNESLLDTFQDITNYGIIAQLVSKGLWKND